MQLSAAPFWRKELLVPVEVECTSCELLWTKASVIWMYCNECTVTVTESFNILFCWNLLRVFCWNRTLNRLSISTFLKMQKKVLLQLFVLYFYYLFKVLISNTTKTGSVWRCYAECWLKWCFGLVQFKWMATHSEPCKLFLVLAESCRNLGQYIGQSFSLLIYFAMCLPTSYALYQLGFSVGICLDVSTCLTALGLQLFSIGKTNCSLCDFALSGPVCVYELIYSICVCKKKSEQNWQPYPERISVCVCQRWEREDRENTRAR